MTFYIEFFDTTAAEQVSADYYKKENGFVTFYTTVEEPTESASGLILSVSEKKVDQIVIDYNERHVKFITPEYNGDYEQDSKF